MLDAKQYRKNMEAMERCENELLRQTTLAESLAELRRLNQEFAPLMRQWEAEAQAEDEQHLAELQARLARAAAKLG